jgi:L-amino acid N-acyltransferase YncA
LQRPTGPTRRHAGDHPDLRRCGEARHGDVRDRAAGRGGDGAPALLAAGFPCLVAELDGAVAGYAYAGAYHSRPAYRWTVENSIYVAEQFQRKGLGGRLLARLIAESQVRGFRQMIAVIGDSTNAASIALHKTAGFRLIGTLRSVGFKHGHWLDVVVMQHALGEGDSTPP